MKSDGYHKFHQRKDYGHVHRWENDHRRRCCAGGSSSEGTGRFHYVIGLSGNGGIDEDALKEWASDPAYVAITPSDEELEDLFEDLDVSGDPDT